MKAKKSKAKKRPVPRATLVAELERVKAANKRLLASVVELQATNKKLSEDRVMQADRWNFYSSQRANMIVAVDALGKKLHETLSILGHAGSVLNRTGL